MQSDDDQTSAARHCVQVERPAGRAPALLQRLVGETVTGVACVGVAAYGMAAAVTLLDIIGRRAGFAVPGVVDLVQLCTLGGAWLVIPYAFWAGTHVHVDLLADWLPASLRAWCGLVALGLALLLLLPMAVEAFAAFRLQQRFGDRSQQLGVPMAWYWLPLLFGLALSILVTVVQLATGRPPEARS